MSENRKPAGGFLTHTVYMNDTIVSVLYVSLTAWNWVERSYPIMYRLCEMLSQVFIFPFFTFYNFLCIFFSVFFYVSAILRR